MAKYTESEAWAAASYAMCTRCKNQIKPGQMIVMRYYGTNDMIEHQSCKWQKPTKRYKRAKRKGKIGNMTTLPPQKEAYGGLPELGKRR